MSVNVPSSPADINAGDLATGEAVVGESSSETDPTDLVEAQHWLYSTAGARLAGHRWDPAWENNTTTQTATPSNSAQPLDQWRGASRITRPRDNGDVVITLQAYCEQLELEWTVIRRDPDGTRHSLTTATLQQGASPAWVASDVALTQAQVSRNGNSSNRFVRIEHSLTAAHDGSNGEKAIIYQVAARAKALVASEIPRR